jgi:GNAT superfamily N-acetyltransferase
LKQSLAANLRKQWHLALRKVFGYFPQTIRFAVFRSFVQCDPKPDARLTLKIAETQGGTGAVLFAAARRLCRAGFMKPAPSGLRATIYHALPTTTTLCAKFDGKVVGTLSLIRESVFGFPLQAIFDLTEIRQRGGKIAEVSALAVHPDFRKTGGAILFPLMKFMYEYCTTFFDTRHLVIAVHPTRIEMYESLLFFERLTENKVDNYDFANGAPAVGASLDLRHAPRKYREVYGGKPARKNLYAYFTKVRLPNIVLPGRRYFTTNDPVMTTDLLDHFFNQRTQVFEGLGMARAHLLRSIYNLPEHRMDAAEHRRRPGFGKWLAGRSQAARATPLFLQLPGGFLDTADRGSDAHCKTLSVRAIVVRGKVRSGKQFYAFLLAEPDEAWLKFVGALTAGTTTGDLDEASRFMLRLTGLDLAAHRHAERHSTAAASRDRSPVRGNTLTERLWHRQRGQQ